MAILTAALSLSFEDVQQAAGHGRHERALGPVLHAPAVPQGRHLGGGLSQDGQGRAQAAVQALQKGPQAKAWEQEKLLEKLYTTIIIL